MSNIKTMEMTETERLMLVKKKETICGATLIILELANDPKNSLEIKKNFQYVLEGLSTIASYSNVKQKNLDLLKAWADLIFSKINLAESYNRDNWNKIVAHDLGKFCNTVNSIRFDFTKRDLKITLPKITLPKNLNIGIITNK